MGGQPAERVTVGELGRRFAEFRDDFHRSIEGIHRRLDELQFVPLAVFEEYRRAADAIHRSLGDELKNLQSELDAQKAETSANRRLAISAIVAPLIVGVAVAIIVNAVIGTST